MRNLRMITWNNETNESRREINQINYNKGVNIIKFLVNNTEILMIINESIHKL